MKHAMLAVLLLLALAAPAVAGGGLVSPPVPVDGNGNVPPVILNVATNSWELLTDTMAQSETQTLGNVNIVSMPELSVTDTLTTVSYKLYNGFDTELLSAATVLTLDLGSVYNLIYITADTDVVVGFDAASLTVLNGDVVAAGAPFLYPYATQYVYAIVKSGIAAAATDVIRVRGLR